MCGMWAIWCQSSPVQNLHRSFRNGQFWIVRTERLVGSCPSVKNWSLGQSQISNFSREVSSWSSKLSRDMRFGRSEILREVREDSPCRPCIGNINSGQPSIINDWKHAALCSSRLRFLQLKMEYFDTLRASNSIDTRLGHPLILNQSKDVTSPSEIEMERDSSPLRS